MTKLGTDPEAVAALVFLCVASLANLVMVAYRRRLHRRAGGLAVSEASARALALSALLMAHFLGVQCHTAMHLAGLAAPSWAVKTLRVASFGFPAIAAIGLHIFLTKEGN